MNTPILYVFELKLYKLLVKQYNNKLFILSERESFSMAEKKLHVSVPM